MKAIIESGTVKGNISAPASKSMTQRAYAAALLHKGKTVIGGAGTSSDENATLDIIQELGAKVISKNAAHLQGMSHLSGFEIQSNGLNPKFGRINCGESGLAARLFTPIAALSRDTIRIEGQGSLLKRPMKELEDVLSQLKVTLPGFTGFLPFSVHGPMIPGNVKMNAADSSQLLSGLLFALSSCVTKPLTITVANLKSKPYIDLTLDMLAHFGKPLSHSGHNEFHIDPAKFTHKETIALNIEGDWSSAAFILVAGAIAGEVTVANLNLNSKQADVAVLTALKLAGASISGDNDAVTVTQSHLKSFEFDATHCPDLFPILSILAACCNGESYIKGVHRLFHKESNRAESISEMLMNFDVPYSIEDDTLCITGVKKLQGTVIDSFNDHRIVMAAAIGALRAKRQVDILNTSAVNKSYPAFFKDLGDCGVKCVMEI